MKAIWTHHLKWVLRLGYWWRIWQDPTARTTHFSIFIWGFPNRSLLITVRWSLLTNYVTTTHLPGWNSIFCVLILWSASLINVWFLWLWESISLRWAHKIVTDTIAIIATIFLNWVMHCRVYKLQQNELVLSNLEVYTSRGQF